jgi:hypothetical protein
MTDIVSISISSAFSSVWNMFLSESRFRVMSSSSDANDLTNSGRVVSSGVPGFINEPEELAEVIKSGVLTARLYDIYKILLAKTRSTLGER